MRAVKVVAMVFMVTGALGLLSGTFTHPDASRGPSPGALELTWKSGKPVPVPAWAGVGAMLAGGALLFVPRRKNGWRPTPETLKLTTQFGRPAAYRRSSSPRFDRVH